MNDCFRLLVFLFILCLPPTTGFSADRADWEELFFRANQAYKEGRYREAIDGYRQILRNGHHNGHLYYNLANAYYRADEHGRAILFYEKARQLIPRDADLIFNRNHVMDQTRDALAESGNYLNSAFFWLDGLTLTGLFQAFAIINIFFFLILSVRLFYRAEWTYYLLLIMIFLEVIAAGSYGLKWYQIHTDRRAVVLEKEVDIFAGPDSQDTVLFKLHAGAIVQYERSEDGWSLIQLSQDKRGWIRSDSLACILCDIFDRT